MENKTMEDTLSKIDSMGTSVPSHEAVLPSRGTRLPASTVGHMTASDWLHLIGHYYLYHVGSSISTDSMYPPSGYRSITACSETHNSPQPLLAQWVVRRGSYDDCETLLV